jgi:hypothetical protein
LNPEIVDMNPQLVFHLQQYILIELICKGKVEEALEFAQGRIGTKGEENRAFLEEVECTVSLLAFEYPSTIAFLDTFRCFPVSKDSQVN